MLGGRRGEAGDRLGPMSRVGGEQQANHDSGLANRKE